MSDIQEFIAEQMHDPEFAEAYKAVDVEVQHQRLRSAVVEAAVARRKVKLPKPNRASGYINRLHAAMVAEQEAVDALIAFEAEHKIGEGK